jgi:ribosome biogenesis GTPase
VTLEQSAGGWAIASVSPRTNVLERRIPGGRGTRPVAANLDQVYVMAATADPEPVLQLLDRLLVLAEANDIPAAVIVNKLDLDPGETLVTRMRGAGYEVYPVCVKTGRGLPSLFEQLRARVSVVTGPSGVGKSSLLNALQPGLGLRIGAISERIGRGKNTTVAAVMIPLEGGGYLVDTPGFSDVGLWGLDPRQLVHCFPDLRDLASRCRFPDCWHLTEPGCGVREAVAAGTVDPGRYQSYRILIRELENLPEEWE